MAAWASAAWLGVPYLGAYPNLPALLLAMTFFEPGTPGQETVVHLFNFTLWPFVGAAAFHARRGRPRAAAPLDPASRLTDELRPRANHDRSR